MEDVLNKDVCDKDVLDKDVLDKDVVRNDVLVKESKLLSQLLGLWRSDWARAVLVGGPGLLIPYYLFANRLKTCYLRAFYPNSNGAKDSRSFKFKG